MKILFVHAASEHLGIEHLSAFLKSRGHETSLVFDPAQFSGQENARIPLISGMFDITPKMLDAVASHNADLIAFSSYTVNFRWALDMAERIREKIDTPIVFGGPHATAVPHRVIRYPQVDAVVVGEGEETLLEMMENMRGGRLPESPIRNVWRKKGDRVEHSPPRPYIRDLDNLPFPDKELFYSKVPAFSKNYMVLASRGCPYRCAFCSNSLYHDLYSEEKNHVRRRSPGDVIEELAASKKKYSIEMVSFWDDVFTMSGRWLEEFAHLYKSEIGLPYDCYTHPLSIDERRAELLADSGCFRVKIGMQTVSDETRRRFLDRAGDSAAVEKTIDILHRHGVSVGVDHMLGLPGEGPDEQKAAAEFYSRTRPERINSYWMLYFPGAKITGDQRESGELTDEDVEKIEEGLSQTSYIYADPSAGRELYKLKSYQTFFDIEPLLPASIAGRLAESRALGKLPYHPLLRQIIVTLAAIFQNDRRYRQHLKLLVSKKHVP